MSIYEYSVKSIDDREISLSQFRGKVILIVNTATKCRFTPQYEQLEKIYEEYHNLGLEIIDIPCDQFLGQAPGTDEEISLFCKINYATKFPQMKKSDVNGKNELPLYTYLESKKRFSGFVDSQYSGMLEKLLNSSVKDWKKTSDIKWNFTKFVIDRNGNVVARFEPTDYMESLKKCIDMLI